MGLEASSCAESYCSISQNDSPDIVDVALIDIQESLFRVKNLNFGVNIVLSQIHVCLALASVVALARVS
ncbi:hypothetical protein BDR05DRAFT_971004 [Suillus weaverae]|nr:hypothetical protein BDR05DRAFT_971004 [Suillus weaverae]